MSGLLEQSAFVGAYFCCGKLGLSMAFVNASASAFWPPTGLAIAFLLWRGLRGWPGVFLGAFLVNIVTQGSPAVDLAIASGNTLEAVIGAWAVRRFANGIKAFENTANASKFFLFAGILSTTLSATVGVTSLCVGGFAGWNRYGDIWLTWWLGDMVWGFGSDFEFRACPFLAHFSHLVQN
jgi:integral membrane sensor domain MASE1